MTGMAGIMAAQLHAQGAIELLASPSWPGTNGCSRTSPTLSACMRARDRFPFVAGTDQCRLELYGALVLFRGGAR